MTAQVGGQSGGYPIGIGYLFSGLGSLGQQGACGFHPISHPLPEVFPLPLPCCRVCVSPATSKRTRLDESITSTHLEPLSGPSLDGVDVYGDPGRFDSRRRAKSTACLPVS